MEANSIGHMEGRGKQNPATKPANHTTHQLVKIKPLL
jgi:hypothetical protein